MLYPGYALRYITQIFAVIEDSVIVAGRTGYGKSTFINYMAGVGFADIEELGSINLAVKKNSIVPKLLPICSGFTAQALYSMIVTHAALRSVLCSQVIGSQDCN